MCQQAIALRMSDDIKMIDVPHSRIAKRSGERKIREHRVIQLCSSDPRVRPILEVAKFYAKYCRLYSIKSLAKTELIVLVLRRASVVAQTAHLRNQFALISCHCAGISVGAKVLSGIETEAGEVTDCAATAALVLRPMRLRSV